MNCLANGTGRNAVRRSVVTWVLVAGLLVGGGAQAQAMAMRAAATSLQSMALAGGPVCTGVSFPYTLSGANNLDRVANLRNAIECANLNGPGSDIIDLNGFDVALEANNVYATYTGPTGLPLITTQILIRDGTLRHDYSAGGIQFRTFEISSAGTLLVQNVVMDGDSAPSPGGAFHNSGTLNVNNSTIHGYDTGNRGGVLFNAGGATASIVNTLLYDNNAVYAHAIDNAGAVTIVNSTFDKHVSVGGFGAILEGTGYTVRNSIFWNPGGGPTQIAAGNTVSDSIVKGGYSGGSNILNTSPLFVNESVNDFRLQATSPAINVGVNAHVPLDSTDVDGDSNTTEVRPDRDLNPRIVATTVDLGAYERQGAPDPCISIIFPYTLPNNLPDTLRQAIGCANANGSADVINLNGQTVTLTTSFADYAGATGLPQVTTDLTLRNGTITRSGASEFRLLSASGAATLRLTDLTLSNGGGTTYASLGAGVSAEGSLFLTRVTMSGHLNTQGGGAIAIPALQSGATVSILDSTLSSNSALGGGAIYFLPGGSGGTLTLSGSTLASNVGTGGPGAIFVSGLGAALNVRNSTFSANSASNSTAPDAIGVFTSAQADIAFSTFSGHDNGTSASTVGIIHVSGGAAVNLRASMMANNVRTGGGSARECTASSATFTGTRNYTADTFCPGRVATPVFIDTTLASNGGPTQTHLPAPHSNVVNADSGNLCAPANLNLSADQRGESRPRGPACDIGAVEIDACGPIAFPYTLPNNTPATLNAAIDCANSTATMADVIDLNGQTVTLTQSVEDAGGQTGLVSVRSPITLRNGTITRSGSNEFRLLNVNGSGNLTLLDLTLSNGGGVSYSELGNLISTNTGSALTIIRSVLTGGVGGTGSGGGAIFASGTLNLINSTVHGNSAGRGGAITAQNGPLLIANSVISGNVATNTTAIGGGALSLNAMIVNDARIINSTIAGNYAAGSNRSGGIVGDTSGVDLILQNSIVWGNGNAGTVAPQIVNTAASSTNTVTHSLIEGGQFGALNSDPLFVTPLAGAATPSTAGNFQLGSLSPAVDAGANADVPADTFDVNSNSNTSENAPDRAGNARRYNDSGVVDTGSGTAPIVDLGAYERQTNSNTCGSVAFPYTLSGNTPAELRLAMQCANANGSGGTDVIRLNGQTITLVDSFADYIGATALPQITTPMTLENGSLTRSGAAQFRLLSVGAGGVLNLNQVNLSNGYGQAPGAVGGGGAIHNEGALNIVGGVYSGHVSALDGGAIHNAGGAINARLVRFVGNATTIPAGGVGGALANTGGVVQLIGVLISGNAAVQGGGIYNNNSGTLTLDNSTVAGNLTNDQGGGLRNENTAAAMTLNNTLVYGNESTVFPALSNVGGNYSGAFNLVGVNPSFVNGLDASSTAPTTGGNYALADGSVAVDAGNNSLIPVVITTDLDGNPRRFNDTGVVDTGVGTAPLVDIGAYERQISSAVRGVNLAVSGGNTAVSEAGATDTYTLVLTAAPSGNVTIAINGGTDLTTLPTALTFTPANWSTPQQVTVSAVNDALVEGLHTRTITHSASGGGYDGVPVPSLPVTITDNDFAAVTIADVSLVEGNSGTSTMTFTAALDSAVLGGFTVDYFTTDITASTSDSDYDAASGTLTFSGTAGETRTIAVTIRGDTKVEADETFRVSLNSGSNASVIITDTALGTISNDDSAVVTIADVVQAEGNASTSLMTFTATLNTAVPGGFTVNYTTTNGTATTADADYVGATGTLTFAGTAGETETFTVTVNGDTKLEANETYTVSMNTVSNPAVTISDTATGTISNDDTASLTIADVARSEGNSSTGNMIFTVTLDNAVQGGFSVNYGATDGTATTADNDFAASSGTLNFTGIAGQTRTFVVLINGDTKVEPDETFTVALSAVSNTAITITDTAVGTINNDDAAAITIANVTQSESGTFTFTATLNNATATAFTADWVLAAGTTSAADYVGGTLPAGGTLTFNGTAGETRTFTVPVLDDSVVEATETFSVSLTGFSTSGGFVVNITDTATGTITDNDTAALTIADVSRAEGNGSTSLMTFTATLNNAVPGGFIVNYASSNGTATTADADYVAASGTLTFAGTAGEAQAFTVTLNGDTKVEPDETFTVALSGSSNPAVTVTDTAVGTISNDDSAVVTIADISQLESGPFTLTATLSNATSGPFAVDWALAAGTTSAADYVGGTLPPGGTLSFNGTAGETRTFTVPVLDDAAPEADETFTVSMTNFTTAGGFVVGITDTATGTIVNNDNVTLSINDVSRSEGNTGTTDFTFTVSLSAPAPSGGVSFDLATADGTAQDDVPASEDNDYVARALAGQSIPAGSSTYSFTVQVNGDAAFEPNETFFVNVGNISGATVSDSQGQGTILNDDVAADFDVTTTPTSITITDTNNNGSTLVASEPVLNTSLRFDAAGRTFSVNGAAPISGNSGTLALTGITSITVNAAGGISVPTGAVCNIGNASYTSISPIRLAGGTLKSTGAAAAVHAPVVLEADSDLVAQSAAMNLTGAISGDFTLRTFGAGSYRFTSTASTFARLNIASGTVVLGGDHSLPPQIDISNSAVFNLNGFDQTIDFYAGSGATQNTGGAADLSIGVAGSASSLGSANYTGPISGPINITIAFGGTQSFGSSGSTYTGTTDVLGTLRVTGSSALGATGAGNGTSVAGTLRLSNVAYAASEALSLPGGTLQAIGAASSFPGPITLSSGVVDIITDQPLLLSGVLSGTAGFLKSGSSSLTLAGSNTYSGSTVVQTGTLLVTGSTAAGTGLQVLGTLSGTGTVHGGLIVVSGGRLAPGLSPGTLTLNGQVNLASSSFYAVEIEGASAGAQYDQLIAAQDVTLSGTTLVLSGSFVPSVGQSFTIIDKLSPGPVVSTFDGRAEGSVALFNGVYLRISYVGGDGNDVVLTAVAPALSINDVSANEGQSGTTDYVYTVGLSLPAPPGGVSFDIATADGSAQDDVPSSEDNDYVARALAAQTIPAGASSYSFTVQVNGDQVAETDETFFVNVSNVVGASVADAQGQGTIVNDDGVATVTVAQSGGTTEVSEGGATDSYTLVLGSQPTADVTIALTPNTQLTTSVPSLTFTPSNWATPQPVTVTAVDDAVVEGAHSGTISHVASGGGYTGVSIATVSASITDNDSASVSIVQSGGTTAVTEGGATDSYTVVLTSQPSASVSIALTGTQVAALPTPLTFTAADWNVAQTVTVSANDDTVVEGNHSGSVTSLVTSADQNYSGLAVAPVSVAITDNDSATLSIGDASVVEGHLGNSAMVYTVTLSAAVSGGVSVPYSSADGTALAGSDYAATSGTLAFVGTVGETQTLSVLVSGDSVVEADETFTVQLGVPSNAQVSLADGQGSGTISNDDSASVSVADVVQAEGDSGTTNFSFVLTLSGQVQDGFSVQASTRDDTAQAGSDYNATDLAVSFDGSLNPSRTVLIGVIGDLVPEARERFWLDLSVAHPSISLVPASAAGEIVNDDLAADLQVSNTLLPGPIVKGGTVAFEVVVENLSAVVDVPAAAFSASLSDSLQALDWTCVADVGASCPASGSGLPNHSIALAAGSSVTYRIRATVLSAGLPTDLIGSTATVSLSSPYSDPDLENNTAVAGSGSADALFEDGFEGP